MMEIPSTVYTHAGKFHADDVFSTALLRLLRPELKVIRTAALPENFEGFAFDIGWGAYDHHQKDAPVRENGVPYAAFGLLWKNLGEQLVGEEWQRFDEHFIQPLDLEDNTGCGHPLAAAIASFNPLWDSQEDPNENFERAVTVASAILERRIAEVNGIRRAKAVVEQAIEQMQDGIVVLDRYAPWKQFVVQTDALFVVSPSQRGGFSAQAVPVSAQDNALRLPFPAEWAGQSAEQLLPQQPFSDFGGQSCRCHRCLQTDPTAEPIKQSRKLNRHRKGKSSDACFYFVSSCSSRSAV